MLKVIKNVIEQLEDIEKSIEKTLIDDDNVMIYLVDNNVLQNVRIAIYLLKEEVEE